ncbi:MAG TPA: MFS transporter [Opitutaceae bacterium]|nr:MFS transporter [Opitutaceae bacterium]
MRAFTLSLRQLKTHYFAVYGVFGCVSPYISVYLRDVKSLAPAQLGVIFAAGQIGVFILPVAMTFLADRYRLVAPLLIALFAINTVAMAGLSFAWGFWACLVCIFFNQLANQPQMALSDGLFFSLQSDPHQPRTPYPQVRVWGTFGFICPSLLIFALFPWGGLHLVPYMAIVCALLGLLNASRMPRRRPATTTTATRLPTLDAARLLLRPSLALFCTGIGCLLVTNAAYYGFYPLYLTQEMGIPARWVGLIANLGVVLEIGYMLMFERLRSLLGLHGLILLGASAILLRMTLLGFVAHPAAAVGLQATHGLTVIGVLIAPLMHVNAQVVSDSYRSSVQGLYAMFVVGVSSIFGNYVAGHLVEQFGLVTLYQLASGFALFGLLLVSGSLYAQRSPR